MNEQEIMKKINEQTKDLPIPDSISPEAMKKMLDESANIKQTNHSIINIANKRKTIRRISAAACIVLVISGALGLSQLRNQTTKEAATADMDEGANMDYEVAADDCYVSDKSDENDAMEESADSSDTTSGNTQDISKDTFILDGILPHHTGNFKKAKNYEEFFKAKKEAYEKIYSIRDYAVEDIDEEMMVEDTNDYKESAATDNTGTSPSKNINTSNQKQSDENDYSSTNTQEKNVDEGDIIKTDGKYIYRVIEKENIDNRSINYQLTITETNNGELKQVASICLNQDAPGKNNTSQLDVHEFYVNGNQLIILYSMDGCSHIAFYNISNKKHPELINTLSQSGNYYSSRIADGYLYTFSYYSDCPDTDEAEYDEYIPKINKELIECSKIYYAPDYTPTNSIVVTSISLQNPGKFTDTICVAAESIEVYVSENALYFYANSYDNLTEIFRIDYRKGIFKPENSTTISGYLYGPFAINEYNHHLRIVATVPATIRYREDSTDKILQNAIGYHYTEDVTNSLYILDDKMRLTGEITDLAEGEIIYSARFIGDTGYFVTYKTMDPLFSIDLSNPDNPKVIGELKIPGFSTYLHPYGDHILLGFGKETDRSITNGNGIPLKLSMFDISDPSNVTEDDKYIIKDAFFSDACTNYKSMMIDPEKNIFGFSYFVKDYNNTSQIRFSTYSYDKKYGFVETGNYHFNKDQTTSELTNLRGVFIGDYLYLSGGNQLSSYHLYKEDMIDYIVLE